MSEVQPETSFKPEARILLDDLKTTIEADMTQIKSALSHIVGRLNEDAESERGLAAEASQKP